MDKQVVLVTGASKGIGAAVVRKMASLGCNIIINYLTSEKEANLLKEEVEKEYNVQALCIKADISLETEVKEMVLQIQKKFNRIDVLVNNAAIAPGNYFNEKTAEEFKCVLDINLVGTFLTSKYVGEIMVKQKSGVIINISSTNGIDTEETYSMDYDASKAGVISLTKNFAKALAPFVRVNAIAPGWTKTDSVMEMNPSYLKEEEQKILLERFAVPSEIANVVAFLASSDASYINKTVIRVDGGAK